MEPQITQSNRLSLLFFHSYGFQSLLLGVRVFQRLLSVVLLKVLSRPYQQGHDSTTDEGSSNEPKLV